VTVWRQPESPLPGPCPVLFLDRDGVVVIDRNYLADPAEVELNPGAARAMVRASRAGFLLVGVSNQSGLGRGLFTVDDLAGVMTRMEALLAAAGTGFDAFYYCPHAPGDGCGCRKPGTGLLDEAAARFDWDPASSWVVGDKADDVGLALAAGLGAILVRTGHGLDQEAVVTARWPGLPGIHVVDDLAAAVDLVLGGAER